MAGLDERGLTIKRLREVIEDRKQSLRTHFGSGVGTGVNTVLGRLARVHADSERDLWEVAEQVFNSFNPDFAQGIALDRIVSYGGLVRYAAQPSVALLSLEGAYGTEIPKGAQAQSSLTNNIFTLDEEVILDNKNVNKFTLGILKLDIGHLYSVSYGGESFSYTAQGGDSEEDVINGLSAAASSHSLLTHTTSGDRISFEAINPLTTQIANTSGRLYFVRVGTITGATSVESGEISQPAGTIDTIGTPVNGWDYVNNPFGAIIGNIRETDDQLRQRFKETKELRATSSIDGIRSSLRDVQGVEYVSVYENVTLTTDSRNIPAKSFAVVVLGGSEEEVAETIWRTKPAGIGTYGSTTESVLDSQGIPHDISFSRPDMKQIFIEIEISSVEGAPIPNNIGDVMSRNIIDYFDANFSLGDDVVYSRLFTPINESGSGYQVVSLLIGESDPPSLTSNIVIDHDAKAVVSETNIEITII